MPSRPAVAIFDVDGAILRGESLPIFVSVAKRQNPKIAALYTAQTSASLLGRIVRLGKGSTGIDNALRWLIARLSPEQLAAAIDAFLDDVLDTQLRPGAIDHLIQRRKAGDRIIFATQAYDFYVGPLAARLGGAEVVATRTLTTPSGRILPKLDGKPCRGAEKLARVKALFSGSRRPPFIRAFASSEQDFGLLAWADAGTAVNPRPALADEAEALGLAVVDWSFGAKDAPVRAPQMPILGASISSETSKQR